MNPLLAKKNKVDVSSLSPEEQRLFRLYGKLPSRSDHFAKHLKERKYFDSGDYAMSKAGKGDSVDAGSVGSQHPVPENIPHLSSPIAGTSNNGSSGSISGPSGGVGASGSVAGLPGSLGAQGGLNTANTLAPPLHHHPSMQAGSPVKESSYLQRETSVNDVDKEEEEEEEDEEDDDDEVKGRPEGAAAPKKMLQKGGAGAISSRARG